MAAAARHASPIETDTDPEFSLEPEVHRGSRPDRDPVTSFTGRGGLGKEGSDYSVQTTVCLHGAWHRRPGARGIPYAFHDYKTAGLDRSQLEAWIRDVGWEPLVNRAGTTFRKLDDEDKRISTKQYRCS
jgi:hypothetical protein